MEEYIVNEANSYMADYEQLKDKLFYAAYEAENKRRYVKSLLDRAEGKLEALNGIIFAAELECEYDEYVRNREESR